MPDYILDDKQAKEKPPVPPQGYTLDSSAEKKTLLGGGGPPPTPKPSEQIQIGSPEQQKHWFEQTESYRKMIDTTATMAAAQAVPGVGLLSTPLRVAFMGVIGAGANAYGQIISRLLGGKDVPTTSTAAAKEIGSEGLMMASAEGLGVGVGALAGKIGATTAKARELLATARQWDMPVSGPEVAGGGISRTLQSVGQSMLGGKTHFFRMQNQFFAGLNTAAEDTVATFSSQVTQESAGKMIQDGFTIARSKFREMSTSLYEGLLSRVEQASGKAPIVDFSKEAFAEGKKIVEEIGQARMKYPEFKEPADIQRLMKSFVPQAGYGIPAERMTETQLPKLTVREAQKLREWVRDLKGSDNKEVQRLAYRFEKVVDDGMRSTLDKIPTEGKSTLKTELDEIDKLYRKGMELFEGKAYSTLVEKFPEHMAHSVGINDITAMRSVRQALVDYAEKPQEWDLFRRMWVQDKLAAAELTDAQPGQRLAKGITDLSDSFASKAKPMADEFFSDPKGKEVVEGLRRLSDLTKAKVGLNVKPDSHLFVNYGILHGLLMVGARMELHALPAVAMTAVAPSALVRVMYNKTATNLVVGAMEAAGKMGRTLTDAEMAQIARGVRLAFQAKGVIAKDKQ